MTGSHSRLGGGPRAAACHGAALLDQDWGHGPCARGCCLAARVRVQPEAAMGSSCCLWLDIGRLGSWVEEACVHLPLRSHPAGALACVRTAVTVTVGKQGVTRWHSGCSANCLGRAPLAEKVANSPDEVAKAQLRVLLVLCPPCHCHPSHVPTCRRPRQCLLRLLLPLRQRCAHVGGLSGCWRRGQQTAQHTRLGRGAKRHSPVKGKQISGRRSPRHVETARNGDPGSGGHREGTPVLPRGREARRVPN